MPQDNSTWPMIHLVPLSPPPAKDTYCFRFLEGADNNVKQKMGGGGGGGREGYIMDNLKVVTWTHPLPPCQSVTGLLKITQRSP